MGLTLRNMANRVANRLGAFRLSLEANILRYLVTRYRLDFIFKDDFGILSNRPVTDSFEYLLKTGNSCDAAPLIRFLKQIDFNFNVSFDVGANIGIVTAFLSTKSNIVYAFEPEPQNVIRLNETIELNHLRNVSIEEIALSNYKGEGELFIFSSYGHHSLGNVQTSDWVKSIPVKCLSIDEFCRDRKIDKIDCLKIDVEGFEHEVLIGARSMLAEKRIHLILFEISRVPLESLGKKPHDVISILDEMGYVVYSLDGSLLDRDLNQIEHEDFYAIIK